MFIHRNIAQRKLTSPIKKPRRLFALLLLLPFVALTGCGGGGGGGSDKPRNSTNDDGRQNSYSTVDIHIGFENEASATRINFPFLILATPLTWRYLTEEFRQFGALVDLWDQAQRGDIMLPGISNVPLLNIELQLFTRHVQIIRTSWDEVGEMCGYGSQGLPNNGCAFHNQRPKCTIYVPHQDLYKNGDMNAYHALLGHEMWHCVVGSFH